MIKGRFLQQGSKGHWLSFPAIEMRVRGGSFLAYGSGFSAEGLGLKDEGRGPRDEAGGFLAG